MLDLILNPSLQVEKIQHNSPDIQVYVVDDFLQNPKELVTYARSRAYFGNVGDDRTAFPGIRDRLPKPYERALEQIVRQVYGADRADVHRCMLSLTTLAPQQLANGQKIPHVDSFSDDQFAAVHYLCGEPHGGTAFYRYLPRNLARMRNDDRNVVQEMLQNVRDHPDQHRGYLTGNTGFYKQEVCINAKFNRLILYPSNLLHSAQLVSPESFVNNTVTGRLSVASFFKLTNPSTSATGIAGSEVMIN